MPDDFVRADRLDEMDVRANQSGGMHTSKAVNLQTVQMVRRYGSFLTAAEMHLPTGKRLHDGQAGQ